MRIAYHIQCHKRPDQVLRMIDRIRRSSTGETIMLVSHHDTGEPFPQGALERGGEGVVFPSSGGYGDFSHLERYLESIRWLADHDDPFDWFVNLSGQDYPVGPAAGVERDLAASEADAWLGFFDVLGPDSKWPASRSRTRYDFRHRQLRRLTPVWQRRLRPLAAINLVQPLVRFSPSFSAVGVRRRTLFTDTYRCYGGSFFGAVNRRAALFLEEQSRTDPTVTDYFRTALAPEEAWVHTVLGNAEQFTIERRARRYFDFSLNDGNHPKLLTMEDFDTITASDAWFARKVDAHDSADLLAALDARNGWD